MRVLHVMDSLAGSGGAEHGLVREISRFSPSVEQRVVRLFERDELEPELTAAGIQVVPLGFRAGSGSRTFPFAAMKLLPIIKQYEPDVVHTTLFIGNLVGQLAARAAGVPVLSSFVLSGDLALLKATQPGAASRKAAMVRAAAAKAARMSNARFRALTEDSKITNCRLLGVPLDRVEVIPRGVPETLGPLKSRGELGLPEGPLVVNLGRVAAQKGQIHLLRSFVPVLEEHADARLVIVGRPGDAQQRVVDEARSLGISDRVILYGYTPDARHILAHGSVFAFSSLMEGLGTSVLEAMMVGVPVVAFDIPPIREATDNGAAARLVPLGDESALAQAIIEGLNGSLADVAERGRRWIAGRGNIDEVAARLEALLASVAASAPVQARR